MMMSRRCWKSLCQLLGYPSCFFSLGLGGGVKYFVVVLIVGFTFVLLVVAGAGRGGGMSFKRCPSPLVCSSQALRRDGAVLRFLPHSMRDSSSGRKISSIGGPWGV